MPKIRVKNVFTEIDKTFPTAKRVLRQNQSEVIQTSAPNAKNIAFQVMYNDNWASWANVNKVTLLGLTYELPVSIFKALDVFLQLLIHPVTNSLTFHVDEIRDVLVLTLNEAETGGDPFANAVYLYVALQSCLRGILLMQQKLTTEITKGSTLAVQPTVQQVHDLFINFVFSYLQTLKEVVDTCRANSVILCLQILQRANNHLRSLYYVSDIFLTTQKLLTKKCASFIEQNNLLECKFLQTRLREVQRRVQDIHEEANVDMSAPTQAALQQFLETVPSLLVEDLTASSFGVRVTGEEKTEPGQITNWNQKFGGAEDRADLNLERFQMRLPNRICVVGRSGLGKTNAVLNFIERTLPNWSRIVVFTGGTLEEPLYQNLPKIFPAVEFYTNIYRPELKLPKTKAGEESKLVEQKHKLIIFDDFIALSPKEKKIVANYATSSRNYKWTCLFLGQKLLGTDGMPKEIPGSSEYFMLFKNRNKVDVRNLKVALNINPNEGFDECYQKATQYKMDFFMVDILERGSKKYRRNFLNFSCNPASWTPKDVLVNFYERFGIPRLQKPESWNKLHMYFPARICMVGPSGSGKTNALYEFVTRSYWSRVVVFSGGVLHQLLYNELLKATNHQAEIYGPNEPNLKEKLNFRTGDPTQNKLIIFDDMSSFEEPYKKLVQEYAIASRKFGWTCIFVGHKFAGVGGMPKVIRDQCNYFIIHYIADKKQVNIIKQNLNVDIQLFDQCYNIMETESKLFIDEDNPRILYPFLMIDQETSDDRLVARLGFDKSCSNV